VTTHLREFTAPTLRPIIGPVVRISHALRMCETSTSKKIAAEGSGVWVG
jgi:hypothetical protein